MNDNLAKFLSILVGGTILFGPLVTKAQDASSDEQQSSQPLHIEEVVVTAQKKAENLQDTPIAIAAYEKTAIADQRINDITDITITTPNVQIAPSPGGTTGATVSIRGATIINPAITWEPAVAIYFDGVFIAKNVGGLFDVAELERIEVLRGPQGTLYGKNTSGGAVNLVTRKPGNELAGSIKAGVGNFSYTEFGFSVDTGTFADIASFNIAYNKRDRDGFYDNDSTASSVDKLSELDSEAGRLAALLDASDNLELYYTYDWSDKNNTPPLGHNEQAALVNGHYELPSPERKKSGRLNGADFDKSDSLGHGLHITWAISDALTFKSITAYREMNFHDHNDYDGTDATIFHAERDVEQDQTSQEFQLLGNTGTLSYVVGLFYFNEQADAINPFEIDFSTLGADPSAAQIVRNFYGVESTSNALFGQLNWLLTDALTLTVGARYTDEEKEFYVEHPDTINAYIPDPQAAGFPAGYPAGVYPISTPYARVEAKDSWSNVSPLLVISYDFSDDMITYFRASTGWTAGGFNAEASSAEEAANPFDEQTTEAYELGLKALWLDGRLQTNIAAFQNTIKDMILSEFQGAYSTIENAGEAEITGVELEAIALLAEGLALFVNYGYMDGKYNDFTIGGVQKKDEARFPYLPKNKFSIGLESVVDLNFAQLRSRIDLSYTDEQDFYFEGPSAEVTHSEDYTLLNARVALVDWEVGNHQTLELSLWGKNLTDEEYRVNGIPQDAFGYGVNYYGDPRTFGADVTYRF